MSEDEIKMIYEVILKGWKILKKYAEDYDGTDKPDEWWHHFWTDINKIMEITDGSIYQVFAKEYCFALIGIIQEADMRRVRNGVRD